jgi:CRP-like cAMP-binding protein
MSVRDIPANELDSFRDYMRVYRKGAVIIQEDVVDQDGLFLLRTGNVSVFKEDQHIADIDAVNFFGEMAIATGGVRSATIKVSSPSAVVYHFQKPDLEVILAEPTWGMLLLRRFSQNLYNMNEELVQVRQESEQYKRGNEYLQKHTTEIFRMLTEVQRDIAMDVVVTAREWKYLNGLAEVTTELLKTRLPMIYNNIEFMTDDFWKELKEEEILPDFLEEFMEECRNKRKKGSS